MVRGSQSDGDSEQRRWSPAVIVGHVVLTCHGVGLTPGKSYTFSVSDGRAKDGTCASYWVSVTAVQPPTIQSTKVSGTDLW